MKIKNIILLLLLFISTQLVANPKQQKIALGAPMPKWINDASTKKEENNIYTNEIYSVQGDKNNKIVWYKRFIIIEGSLGPFEDWHDSKYTHAIIKYSEGKNISSTKGKKFPKRTIECSSKSVICKDFKHFKNVANSFRNSPHKLSKIEIFYEGGNVSKMVYDYPYKRMNKFLFSIEHGKRQ